MPLLDSTKTIQNNLGKFCQTGDVNISVNGARADRLPHYRRLVFNVILDSLSSAFPLTQKLLGKVRFENVCHDFFSNYACQEPQVFRMAGEFARYMQQKVNDPLFNEFPFIGELLEFEWTEMDMYMMEDIPVHVELNNKGNWLTDRIALNPESRLLQFTYPVFKVRPAELSEQDKALYYCYAYRQPETGKIMFLDLSPLMAVIISQIAEGHSLVTILNALMDEGVSVNEEQKKQIISFLKTEQKNGLLIGFYT